MDSNDVENLDDIVDRDERLHLLPALRDQGRVRSPPSNIGRCVADAAELRSLESVPVAPGGILGRRHSRDQRDAGVRARALVVDVRGNGGGDDRVGRAIANRFADRKRLYMTVALRNGPGHDSFAAPVEWFVEPAGPLQFTRPVVLLTHRFSVSAAENFALAMRTLPHVIQAGDITSGAFADTAPHTLPNGWRFSAPFNLFRDRDGFCWEGIGIRRTTGKSTPRRRSTPSATGCSSSPLHSSNPAPGPRPVHAVVQR